MDQPGHGDFITLNSGDYDWRNPQNDNLWQGVNGVNNPCPIGYRVPTSTELEAEFLSWSENTSVGAYASPLKLPNAGFRSGNHAWLADDGSQGFYWSSTVSGTDSRHLDFTSFNNMGNMGGYRRNYGLSIRCVKD
jgi:uncharacterized protein (TIGR02145 family)